MGVLESRVAENRVKAGRGRPGRKEIETQYQLNSMGPVLTILHSGVKDAEIKKLGRRRRERRAERRLRLVAGGRGWAGQARAASNSAMLPSRLPRGG